MTSAPWIKHVRLAFCAATLALAAMTGTTAWAQDADEDEETYNSILNTDRRLVDQVLENFGLISRAPGIEYRERSPLVVPASRDLPPPGAKAAKGADWPLDPEVKAKRKAIAASRNAKPVDPAKPISGTPEMYRVGETGKWDEGKPNKEPGFLEMIASGKMFQLGENRKEEVGTFTGEPPRTSLIAPPAGYLTPSPAAPYGVTPRTSEPIKKEPKL